MTTNLPDPAHDSEPNLSCTKDKVFNKLFAESMGLINDMTNYLGGPGHDFPESLPRPERLVYADWGIVLSKRLIRGTIWLIAQKAVRDGKTSREEGMHPKYQVTRDDPVMQTSHVGGIDLPVAFLSMLQRSEKLFEQICRLDETMRTQPAENTANPIHNHIEQLQEATETGIFATTNTHNLSDIDTSNNDSD